MYTLWFVYGFLIFVRLEVRKKNKGLIIVTIWEKCTDKVFRLNMLVCLKIFTSQRITSSFPHSSLRGSDDVV